MSALKEHGLQDIMLVAEAAEGGNHGWYSVKGNGGAKLSELAGNLGTYVEISVPEAWMIACLKAAGYKVIKEM